jgi:hypothetical protein
MYNLIDPRTNKQVDVTTNVALLLFRAQHAHLPTPTPTIINKFEADVAIFKKQKMTDEEAINLAFSIIRWHEIL